MKTKKTQQQGKKRVKEGMNRSGHSMNPNRPEESAKGASRLRDKATIRRLQMYRNFKPKRNRRGQIVRAAPFQNRLASGSTARVEPNPKWFVNTRVVTQNALQTFQENLGKALNDTYQVVMRKTKLPISLLQEKGKQKRPHVLDTEDFECTFGPKSRRKRPQMQVGDLEELVRKAEEGDTTYDEEKDLDRERDDLGVRDLVREPIMKAGQSKRIWNELYKVIDSSDVVIEVLDARDPMGTRSLSVEEYLRKEKTHKHLVLLLSKSDLIPTPVTRRWIQELSKEYPTLAFHSSLRNPFGKGALIALLRQFGKLHADKKQISVGFIGYPNTGKSSIINTLRSKKVCSVAPIAGQTKVWQYVTLMRRIYLIDCPGVVYPHRESDAEKVLKGVVRVELVEEPSQYIPAVLDRVRAEHIGKTYGIWTWRDPDDFLECLARKTGKLLKKGDPDVNTVAKMVLNDWQRGKLPWYVLPPNWKEKEVEVSERETTSGTFQVETLPSPDGENASPEVVEESR
ncbi:unnamed protein product [Darwinula stevensoni]|uniref:Nucleolar GTP-binding protein 2 n=1 Tax=Darwinula stevensoni TaxID=69355 RepID=A0A7R8XHS8_9CRUS|nr:unnamed protein product [Darwinula stevensoni]CAG0892798.1 unnamed protein product [Darwinula stevensoni]